MQYVALLRGINVGGHKVIKMAALRESLMSSGLVGVTTYLQSGNFVFESKINLAKRLEAQIAKTIMIDFGFEVSVLVKSAEDFRKIAKANPFVKIKGIDETKLHVTFLSSTPAKQALKLINQIDARGEQCACVKGQIFLYCPNGYGNAKLTNNLFEKILAVGATTRNWKTVKSLLALIESS